MTVDQELEVEREKVSKFIKIFEVMAEGLDKGKSIRPKSEIHDAVKLVLWTFKNKEPQA